MIHLLIIAEDDVAFPPPAAPPTSAEFKLVRKPDLAAARPLVEAGLFDACLVIVDALSDDTGRMIADFRAAAPRCPLIVARPHQVAAADQAAYLAGADAVLPAPPEPTVVMMVIRRLIAAAPPPPMVAAPPPPAAAPAPSPLAILRDFSRVFTYSLDYRELTRQFAFKLREILGTARVAIFLEPEPPAGGFGMHPIRPLTRLVCAGAVGLPAGLVECFELSRESGLGRHIEHTGRILRQGGGSTAPFLAGDARAQREFEVLGCEVALPVSDRERTLGVVLLGERITGVPFSDAELLLVYHLMEELGLAVRNSRLHRELSSNHRLFSDVLGAMTNGALAVGPDLAVLFANQALWRLLGDTTAPARVRLEFDDLPEVLKKNLHEAVENGRAVAPFLYEHRGPPARMLRVSIIPFGAAGSRPPQPALLLLEDFTQVHAAQRAEIEASNLKLIGLIARRFAHEIRNSLVPLTTHEQLFDTDYADAEFRDSLKHALTRETRRIQRFTEQMLFLAQPERGPNDVQPLDELLQTSFSRSRDFLGEPAQLEIQSELAGASLRCHRPSLAHALQEIFLNGLQSAGSASRVSVTVAPEAGSDGRPGVSLRIRDSGRGFAPEVAGRAADPFFTTRNTGVGLGLTVAKRVIEAHSGRLEVRPRTRNDDPDLIIHLPLNL